MNCGKYKKSAIIFPIYPQASCKISSQSQLSASLFLLQVKKLPPLLKEPVPSEFPGQAPAGFQAGDTPVLKSFPTQSYYLYSPSDISDKISQQAAADYQKFMTTKTYTDYTKAYEVFLKKNPGYEDKIASKLNG